MNFSTVLAIFNRRDTTEILFLQKAEAFFFMEQVLYIIDSDASFRTEIRSDTIRGNTFRACLILDYNGPIDSGHNLFNRYT